MSEQTRTLTLEEIDDTIIIGGQAVNARNTVLRIEPLASVKRRQVMWLDWMADATEGLTDDDMVETISEDTPFGTFLLNIRATPI
jgi:hypothetical protein